MIGLNVKADAREVERVLAGIRGGAPTVLRRALNRTITPVRAEAARDVAQDMRVRVGTARRAMALRRATNRSLEASVTASGQRIPLIEFRARPVRQGISYDLGRGRTVAKGAFLSTMKSGHRGAFRRKGKSRLPIGELRGPSIPHVFLQEKIVEAMRRVAGKVWSAEVERQLRFFLSRRHG